MGDCSFSVPRFVSPFLLFLAVGLPAATLLGSCGGEGPPPLNRGAGRIITDPMGGELLLSSPPERIISSAPSNTEIIIDLGMGEKLTAVDKYSRDVPGLDRSLPMIDFLYPDAEGIIALEPDLIIASEHNMAAGEDPFRLIREAGIVVAYIPTTGGIAEIYRDIAFIAELLGVPEKGAALIGEMKAALERTAAVGAGIEKKKTVYFEISPAPNMVSFGRGTFLHEMLEIIGAENIFTGSTGWIAPGAEAIIAANPEVILTNSDFLKGEDVGEVFSRRPGFGEIRAVRNGAIHRIDADSSSRPTHHITKALLEMARAVYPEYYD
ncbi:MAG: ABC transporter substrate-binding protein, partial [Treponema sp.]|nr:ABC transporter substrate-binding protein [Treponema sp.]